MDVVVTFGNEKFIVELKIWNGEKYEGKGLNQLSEYLDIQGLDTGYMIVFNFNENKEYIRFTIKSVVANFHATPLLKPYHQCFSIKSFAI